MSIAGGCRCGAVRYGLVDGAVLAVYACHCRDCQTWSGSGFAEHALLPADALTCSGPTISWVQPGGEAESEQVYCAICHTRIYNHSSAVPGMIVLRAGTLAASDRIAPIAHIWISRKQPWLSLPPDVPTWDESPTPEQFETALARR